MPYKSAARQRAYIKYKNSVKGKIVSKKIRLKYYYGITLEEYEKMVEKQNGVCKICNNIPRGRYNSFHIDHCHTTNKIRGLLCDSCNRMLGFAKDNIIIFANAIKYLEENNVTLSK